jgi:GDP-L-fucose synthase
MKSRVVVTGAAGFIGHNLVARLVQEEEKYKVCAIVHRKDPPQVFPNVDYRSADLRVPREASLAMKDHDTLFMCAANTSGSAVTASTPMTHVTPNVVMNAHTFEAAHNSGIRKVIWICSTTGYPDTDGEAVYEHEMHQGEPYSKYFFVGHTKRFGERLLQMYTKIQNPFSAVSLRLTNAYGPHDDFDLATSHVLPALVNKVVSGHNPVEVWGDGTTERDFIYVDDVVEAMILSEEKMNSGFTAMNLGLGVSHSVDEVLRIIVEKNRSPVEVVYNADKPTMIPKRNVNIGELQRRIGFVPSTSLEVGIEKTIEWYKAREWIPGQ